MIREVRARDGRSWMVRSEINWSRPAVVQDFEHDVAGGRMAGTVMLAGVVLVLLLLLFGEPDGVYFPYWLRLALLAVLLALPAHWVVNRPWTIVAETHEPLATNGEHWVGTVRGFLAARDEAIRATRNLEEYSSPDDGRGPMQLVT